MGIIGKISHISLQTLLSMPRLYVGGPSGCGKTLACKSAAQKLGITYFTGSEIMMKAACVSTREELNALFENIKEDLRLRAFEFYYQTTPNLVIDGHFYLTETDISYLNSYILVEIDPERLIKFRKIDLTRERSHNSISIETEIAELEARVCKLQSDFRIEVIRIKNDGSLDDLVGSLEREYMRSIKKDSQ